MWLVDFFKNIGGFGSELSALNLAVLAALGFFLRREYRRVKKKVDPLADKDVEELVIQHDEMYADFRYRKRRNASGRQSFTDREMISGMVSEILKERESRQ